MEHKGIVGGFPVSPNLGYRDSYRMTAREGGSMQPPHRKYISHMASSFSGSTNPAVPLKCNVGVHLILRSWEAVIMRRRTSLYEGRVLARASVEEE